MDPLWKLDRVPWSDNNTHHYGHLYDASRTESIESTLSQKQQFAIKSETEGSSARSPPDPAALLAGSVIAPPTN